MFKFYNHHDVLESIITTEKYSTDIIKQVIIDKQKFSKLKYICLYEHIYPHSAPKVNSESEVKQRYFDYINKALIPKLKDKPKKEFKYTLFAGINLDSDFHKLDESNDLQYLINKINNEVSENLNMLFILEDKNTHFVVCNKFTRG